MPLCWKSKTGFFVHCSENKFVCVCEREGEGEGEEKKEKPYLIVSMQDQPEVLELTLIFWL